eukprot:TRINITY_DN66590_c0_g1_i1.p1 TRINITY_DN66590_c0_g1~~TRINITY_DN66590_c0_g1_i1.p1  ORF type:complete len:293 (+),score=31.20 TRINITY_DN66590_c0_g1_i1:81-959(+)
MLRLCYAVAPAAARGSSSCGALGRPVPAGGPQSPGAPRRTWQPPRLGPQRRCYGHPSSGDAGLGVTQSVRDFFDDLQRFPETFNWVTYVVCAMTMMWFLYWTSNQRCRRWLERHFTLSPANIQQGRVYTVLTHQLLETSMISLLLNVCLLRVGGRHLMNSRGEDAFLRAYAALSAIPAGMYYMIMSIGMDLATSGDAADEFITLHGSPLEVPRGALVPRETVSGAHGVAAGLFANYLIDINRNKSVTSRVLQSRVAIPGLCGVYILMAWAGSSDAWLSLFSTGVVLAFRSSM